MDPILSFCHKHEQNLLKGLVVSEEDPKREDLEQMTMGLWGWRVLFKALRSAQPHWLPASAHQESLKQLRKTSEHLADLYALADTLKETEVNSGMDLSYLHRYSLNLIGEKEKEMENTLTRFNNTFPGEYGKYLAGQLAGDDSNQLHVQLVHFTNKKIKKALKRVGEKNGGKKFLKLRRNLIDAIYLLDLVGLEDTGHQLMDASLFLEIWYKRRVCLKVIESYRRDYPGQASRYKGTLEILEDYMHHKSGVI